MRATPPQQLSQHPDSGRVRVVVLFAVAVLIVVQSTSVSFADSGLTLLPYLEHAVFGQQPKKSTKATTKKAVEPEVDPALKRDKTALPPDYQVPPDKLPDIDIVKESPVPTKKGSKEEGYAEWRKHLDKMKAYDALLRKGNFADAKLERETLRYGIQYKLARMTQRSILFATDEDREKVQKAQEEEKKPDAPETIGSVRDNLLKDLQVTNAFNGGMEVRDAFLDILCEEAPKLLDNNYYVRFNVALILSTINSRDQDKTRGIPEDIPCFKALKPLLELVNDPKQHPLYKVHPVQGLARMCRHKNCPPEDRFAIIETLLKQMALAKTLPDWYGWRLAESLSLLGDPNDRTRQPVVVDALLKVLKDTGYSYRIRSQAAHSLGRVSLKGFRKADEIAIEMLRLSEQMAPEFEKSKTNPKWRLYFAYVYLGFQPRDPVERGEKKGLLVQVDSEPTLAPAKTVVTEAYQLFKPLAQNVLGSKAEATIPDQLRKIKAWLDQKGKAGNGTPVAEKGN